MGPRFVNIDHDTLCAFRRNNLALINESFVRVLEMAEKADSTPLEAGPSPEREDGLEDKRSGTEKRKNGPVLKSQMEFPHPDSESG